MNSSSDLEICAPWAAVLYPPSAVQYYHALAPLLCCRSASTHELVDAKAHLDALQKTRRKDKSAEIRRQNHGSSRLISLTRNKVMGSCFLPLKKVPQQRNPNAFAKY